MDLIKKLSANKKTLVSCFGLILLFSFATINFANAAGLSDIWKGIMDVGDYIKYLPLLMFFGMPITIIIVGTTIITLSSFAFYSLCTSLLTFVTSEAFVSLSATRGGIVDEGLRVTTGLANLIFILVLVVIAIATILRRENYGLKKLLPKFLIVILLINFVPVFCGIVIDIANIVTRHFLIGNLGDNFMTFFNKTPLGDFVSVFTGLADQMQPETSTIIIDGEEITQIEPTKTWTSILDIFVKYLNPQQIITLIIDTVMMSLFGIMAGIVILLYVAIFAIRIVALWILVILAPIAWFCQILPTTQKVFKMWLNYFIQWSFIGAIGGFFLYLAGRLTKADIPYPKITETGAEGIMQIIISPVTYIMNGAFVLIAFIAFMIIGFVVTLKFSGGGTEAVLQWGNKGLNWAKKKGLSALRSRTDRGLREFTQNTREDLRAKVASGQKVGLLNKMRLGAGNMIDFGYRVAGTTVGEKTMAGVEVGKKDAKDVKDPENLERKIMAAKRLGNKEKLTGLIAGGIEAGKESKKRVWDMFERGRLSKEEIISSAASSNRLGKKDDAERMARGFMHTLNNDDLAKMGFELSAEEQAKYGTLTDKIWAETSGDEVKDFKDGSWLTKTTNPDTGKEEMTIRESILKNYDGKKISKMVEEFGSPFADDYINEAKKKGLDWFTEIEETSWTEINPNTKLPETKTIHKMRNAKAAKFLIDTPALTLGVGIAGVDEKDFGRNVAAKQILESNSPLNEYIENQKSVDSDENSILKAIADGQVPAKEDIQKQIIERNEEIFKARDFIDSDPLSRGQLQRYKETLSKQKGKGDVKRELDAHKILEDNPQIKKFVEGSEIAKKLGKVIVAMRDKGQAIPAEISNNQIKRAGELTQLIKTIDGDAKLKAELAKYKKLI
ncbi:MAG: hypothetical protein PHW72_00525 [Candidatus Pacebacteria bacterium]|nr:hypothetical protein [Candidatus Paceibacterota bacterium]